MAAANYAFNNVLHSIQNSCLNYHIQMSPFSAVISLKKSLVKSKSGSPSFPTMSDANSSVSSANREELDTLKRKHAELMIKYDDAIKTIKTLTYDIDARDDVIQNLIQAKKVAAGSADMFKVQVKNSWKFYNAR